jgi:CysZ protein
MILVAGGAGYLGRNVARALPGRAAVLDDLRNSWRAAVPQGTPFFQQEAGTAILDWSDHEAVVYCAGSSDVAEAVKHPAATWWNNVATLLAFFQGVAGKKVVFASTCQAGGNPYADSMRAAEEALRKLDLRVAVVRTSIVAAGTVICAPFNEWLSRGLERILVPGAEAPGGGWRGAVQEVALAIAHALMRVALLAVLLIAALPLQWVPILGQAVLVLIAAQFLALEGLDPCLARRRLSFREKWRFIGSHRSRTLGLGTAAYLLLLVPFTALVVLPLLAAAGTVLWCEIEGERRRAAGERAG